MRAFPRLALTLLGLVTLALPALAQEEMIGLERIHQLLTDGQARLASRELQVASVAFRSEIGRCRDEGIGARLVELEPRFTALAERVQAGTVTPAALEQEFVAMDRLLAENHLKLAVTGWGLRRFGRLEAVASDLRLAALYLTRSAKWARQPLAADLQQAVDAALIAARDLAASPAAPPAGTGPAIEQFEKALKLPR